jgi:hypothetical protein
VVPPPAWIDAEDVDFVYTEKFTEARCSIPKLRNTTNNGTASTIQMKQPCFWNLVDKPYQKIRSAPKYIDNVKEHFSVHGRRGTFYWDRAQSRILYIPRPGKGMHTMSAVAATDETLMTISAGAANHRFESVSFEYATWLQPGQEAGYVEQQAPSGGTEQLPGWIDAAGCELRI